MRRKLIIGLLYLNFFWFWRGDYGRPPDGGYPPPDDGWGSRWLSTLMQITQSTMP